MGLIIERNHAQKNHDMKTPRKLSSSLLGKVSLIAVVTLVMLIPVSMIESRINERENTMTDSIRKIEATWGDVQYLSGPKLMVSYREWYKDQNGKLLDRTDEIEVYPKTLSYDVDARSQDLHRSIYDVTVYSSLVKVRGEFLVPDKIKDIIGTQIVFGLSDLKGIEGNASVTVDGDGYEFQASDTKAISAGITLDQEKVAAATPIPFSMEIKVKGSEALMFRPVAGVTEVKMTSNCATPSFDGDFLPSERNVTAEGFSASWIISQINRGEPESTSFGVRMLQPVTQYRQTTRSAKYAILIILLVFLAGLLVEFLTRKEINIVQYAVIGLSLVLFYALLLAFSEFMAFGLAYLLAAGMTVLALTAYFRAILKNKVAYVLGVLVAAAYGVSYVLLQMETFAFLCGTLILFALLCVMMYFTRNIGATEEISG